MDVGAHALLNDHSVPQPCTTGDVAHGRPLQREAQVPGRACDQTCGLAAAAAAQRRLPASAEKMTGILLCQHQWVEPTSSGAPGGRRALAQRAARRAHERRPTACCSVLSPSLTSARRCACCSLSDMLHSCW